ncbi:MAG TPA: tetratricopeptide repeat protein, partial [bacterium]|nr:tetratricopeptide repeat protein [bacterium]
MKTPTSAELLEAGKKLLREKDYETAERHFIRALADPSLEGEAVFELGKLHYIRKKYASAIEKFERARLLLPENREVPLFLLKIHKEKGDRDRAAEEYLR